jgi:hypothetical protein
LLLPMEKFIHILYVDGDPINAGQVLRYFNPPKYMSPKLLTQQDLKASKNQPYQFIFIHCQSYRKALQILMARNSDPHPLAKRKGKPAIYTLLIEINRKNKTATEKYNWLDLLNDIHQLGTHRLGLTNGFLAFGSQASESVKDQLMSLGVREFIKKPFTVEELNDCLVSYTKRNVGSRLYHLDENKENLEEGRATTRRSIRYYTYDGKMGSIELPSIEEERENEHTVIWLRNIEDEEEQQDIGFTELADDEMTEEQKTPVD